MLKQVKATGDNGAIHARVFSLVGVHDEVGFEMAMTDGADHVELRPEARAKLSQRGQVPGASEFGLAHAIDGVLEQLVVAVNQAPSNAPLHHECCRH